MNLSIGARKGQRLSKVARDEIKVVREKFFAACALAALGACGRAAAPADVPSPPSAAPVPADGLRVTLLWSEPVDLDLYVTDPARETVYFGNGASRSGGRLERDTRCAEGRAGPGAEVVS